ncbi:hypothetical protein MNBD_ALPHA11-715, partial [hydrothermal vent metagenome]
MIELEKLYESARVRLDKKNQGWLGFAADFEEIFQSKFVLYRPTFDNGVSALRSRENLIASTNLKLVDEYIKKRVFDSNQIHDDSLNPFEPSRRSDVICDSIYEEIDIVKSYFLPNGIFYMLAVSALLTDKSYLMLVTWRAQTQNDFSDSEMQRLALFMRYLAVLVRGDNQIDAQTSNTEVKEFGQKYGLTDTEIDILSALLQGQSLKIIAYETKRSYNTIRWHVQNILEK